MVQPNAYIELWDYDTFGSDDFVEKKSAIVDFTPGASEAEVSMDVSSGRLYDLDFDNSVDLYFEMHNVCKDGVVKRFGNVNQKSYDNTPDE